MLHYEEETVILYRTYLYRNKHSLPLISELLYYEMPEESRFSLSLYKKLVDLQIAGTTSSWLCKPRTRLQSVRINYPNESKNCSSSRRLGLTGILSNVLATWNPSHNGRVRRAGIEPSTTAWQAKVLTTEPPPRSHLTNQIRKMTYHHELGE